jgi:hypothetical protein
MAYDIVFISYRETNAEQNWKALNTKTPRAKRLHGVKGIHQAHIVAASMVHGPMFYCVDGDAVIEDEFAFDHEIEPSKQDHVHVFRARNPVNDLVYGYGAVKLLPTEHVRNLSLTDFKTDMTTSINSKYQVVEQLSNVTAFNTDAFNAWRSAFRECAKLASRIIPSQIDAETQARLEVWCTVGADRPHGQWCIYGALDGRQWGLDHAHDQGKMMMINDTDWLRARFMEHGR